jgi:threonylcarbamoyladenosine tRNA methylthiotransferase MtaB
MNTVAFHTLGCKLNFAETSSIARSFMEAGWEKVEFGNAADVNIINTCSVTEQADKECKTIVNRALQANASSFIAVVGCYAQLKPESIASINGVDLVLGASEKFNLLDHIQSLQKTDARIIACDIDKIEAFKDSWSSGDRTRVFLKVQDGCDYQCTFCTIPLARGKSRSDSVKSVIINIEKILATGAKEIVLTGVNLGDFGIVNSERKERFADLIKAIEKIDADFRVRISSIEPNLLTNEIIELVAASDKMMPHFHIPLQSGSNKILKQMRRRYQKELYTERINYIKQLMQHCCIGADVITGFPGETQDDFNETFRYLQSLDISYLHVFTYSERNNTIASSMAETVPVHIRRERNKQLRQLSAEKLNAFYNSFIGEDVNVLMEAEEKDGMMYGYSENYIRAKMPYNAALANKVVTAALMKSDEDNCMILSEDILV